MCERRSNTPAYDKLCWSLISRVNNNTLQSRRPNMSFFEKTNSSQHRKIITGGIRYTVSYSTIHSFL